MLTTRDEREEDTRKPRDERQVVIGNIKSKVHQDEGENIYKSRNCSQRIGHEVTLVIGAW